MDKPPYPFKQFERELLFEFQSISQDRTIRKLIAYECIDDERQLFNLALLDVGENGTVDDLVVSNNQDMEKVLATVITTIPVFFGKFSEATIVFQGSSPARTRLYRVVIGKYLLEIERDYIVYGILPNTNDIEQYERNQPYIGFYVKRKKA